MTSEEAARRQLVDDLRRHSAQVGETDRVLSVRIAQAANEIESLADCIDFRVADRLSEGVREAVAKILHQENDGWEPFTGPIIVSNDGFNFSITEGKSKHEWKITCHRKERRGGSEGIVHPA